MPYLSASEVMIHEEALYEVCYLYLCLQITPTWQNARPNRMREGKFFLQEIERTLTLRQGADLSRVIDFRRGAPVYCQYTRRGSSLPAYTA